MASNNESPSKKPLNVYVVTEREYNGEVHKRWREVGVAFKHDDGESFSIQIEPGLSISGTNIVVRPRKEREDAAQA
jgi:hypothetical protein